MEALDVDALAQEIRRVDGNQIMTPVTIRRASGAWLAVSPSGAELKIGVTGDTEAEAVEHFRTALSKWLALIEPIETDLASH